MIFSMRTLIITIIVIIAIYAYLNENIQEATETHEQEGNKYVIPFIPAKEDPEEFIID